MAKIFLCYRRQDSAAMDGRTLRAPFGDNAVFMDIDSIPFGVDFRDHIDAAVGQCDVFLAVIGTKWTGRTLFRRRLDNPRDFVRIELESALKRNLPVIPILIDRATLPGEADLPQSLARLAFRNAIEVDQGRDFHPHVDRLVKGIEPHLQRKKAAPASPPSQRQEHAAELRLPIGVVRPRTHGPNAADPRFGPTQPTETHPDRPPSVSDPGQQSNDKAADSSGGRTQSRPRPYDFAGHPAVRRRQHRPGPTASAAGGVVGARAQHLLAAGIAAGSGRRFRPIFLLTMTCVGLSVAVASFTANEWVGVIFGLSSLALTVLSVVLVVSNTWSPAAARWPLFAVYIVYAMLIWWPAYRTVRSASGTRRIAGDTSSRVLSAREGFQEMAKSGPKT